MKTLLKYICALTILGFIGLYLLDAVFLPLITKTNNNIYLPDVKSENVNFAEKKLSDLGFKVEIIKSTFHKNIKPNTVINMSPRAFTKVKRGRLIKLTVSGEKELIELQDYKGMSLTNAKLSLKRYGINLDTIIYEYNDDIKKNYITTQYPEHGKVLLTHDNVSFVVSLGSPPNHYTVPNLINTNFRKAKEIISKSGLLVGEITYEINKDYLDNTVLEQSLTPGMRLSFPEYINLIVTKDEKE